ncbi:MAG: PIG-L family deacetylase [Acidimicrobiia bacterium]
MPRSPDGGTGIGHARLGTARGGEFERVVIVSPHLDDAVLGCGRFMALHPGVTVVTRSAGHPAAYPDPTTHWDAISGFGVGDDVLAARRQEDEAALAEVGARPVWLDVVEHQYLERPDWVGPDRTTDPLDAAIRALDPTAVFLPFGLANPDHGATHDAGMAVRDRYPDPAWFCYEDSGYKHIPGLLAWRVSTLFRRNVWPTPVAVDTEGGDGAKRRALGCYRSQMRALEADWQIGPKLGAPEQLWRLAPPPAGWEGLSDAT